MATIIHVNNLILSRHAGICPNKYYSMFFKGVVTCQDFMCACNHGRAILQITVKKKNKGMHARDHLDQLLVK